ncbi:hypothetical protein [Paenibacillus periandrae]|uniref:hypothetical protein n=1 Tax=Paenibacillus periandrae TaxID=1761741 RepID=UPI001F08925A|nr:hypothetical protein [Paenibacillus periandrae]
MNSESDKSLFNELRTNLDRHYQPTIMLFLEANEESLAKYICFNYNQELVCRFLINKVSLSISPVDVNNNLNQKEDFIEKSKERLNQHLLTKFYPSSVFITMPEEIVSDNLYMLMDSSHKSKMEYLYSNSIIPFGEVLLSKLNGIVTILSTIYVSDSEKVFEVVRKRLMSCYMEKHYHNSIKLEYIQPIIQISNDNITLADIPKPNASWERINRFALSFNGYQEFGSFDAVVKIDDIVNDKYKETGDFSLCSITELRTSLFLIQRGCTHRGDQPEGEHLSFVQELIEEIRTKVNGNDNCS